MPIDPNAPWANDFATYFADGVNPDDAFQRYMSEKQQPYVTQLEEGSKDARELWTDLNADPEKTLRDLYEAVYKDDPTAVEKYDAIFAEETPAADPPPATSETTTPAALTAEQTALLEWAQNKRDAELVDSQAAEYAAYKETLKEEHSLTDDDVALLDPFIAAAPDGPAAIVAYNAWKAKFAAANGVVPTPTPEVPAPPPVLTDGVAPPPTATPYTKYDDIGQALRDYSARQAASATPPPVVG
jgi:hypothetical protein